MHSETSPGFEPDTNIKILEAILKPSLVQTAM